MVLFEKKRILVPGHRPVPATLVTTPFFRIRFTPHLQHSCLPLPLLTGILCFGFFNPILRAYPSLPLSDRGLPLTAAALFPPLVS